MFEKKEINVEDISRFLIQLYPDEDLDILRESAAFRSRAEKSVSGKLCRLFFPNAHIQTIKKYTRRIYCSLRRHFPEIKSAYDQMRADLKQNVESTAENNLPSTSRNNSSPTPPADLKNPDSPISQSKQEIFWSLPTKSESLSTPTLSISSLNDTNIGGISDDSNEEKTGVAVASTANTLDNCLENIPSTSADTPDTLVSVKTDSDKPENSRSIISPKTLVPEDSSADSPRFLMTKSESFIVSREFWKKYWTQSRALRKGWTDEFVEFFKSEERYKYCVLAIKYHRCYLANRKRKLYFSIKAHCKNSLCTSYRFECYEPISSPFKDIEIAVLHDKDIRHNESETHQRFKRSENLKKVLDTRIQVDKLSSELNKEEYLSGQILKGYFQGPVNMMCFSEKQILYLHSLNSPENFCYLGATGCIIEKFGPYKPIYYYPIVLAGGENFGPMPVAEYFTNSHNSPEIRLFLSSFREAVRKCTGRNFITQKIEVDFSFSIITGVVGSIYEMPLSMYLEYLFSLLQQEEFKIIEMTIIHVCFTHFIETIKHKCNEFSLSEDQQAIALYLINQLINCTKLEDAAEIVITFTVFFGLPYINKIYAKYYNSLPPIIPEITNKHATAEQYIFEDFKNDFDKGINDRLFEAQTSLFFIHFNNIYQPLIDEIEENRYSKESEENIYHSQDLFDYFTKILLPFFPLWSAVLISRLGFIQESNATVGKYFETIKSSIIKNTRDISVPRFIEKMEPMVYRWLLERQST